MFKKIIIWATLISFLSGCSTAGGWYKKDDPKHGQFSAVNSVFAVVGVAVIVAGAAAASKNSGGGGGSNSYTSDYGYAWDYQPGNNQWVCRDKSNGQYAYKENCANEPFIDHWQ